MSYSPDSKIPGLRCFIVADDLTGSCDAAVHFAHSGITVAVTICADRETRPAAHVVAVNTDSRGVPERVAANRVKTAFQMSAHTQSALFKKIDSSLRGHVSAEIAAAAQASGCDLVFVAPALPALGRTVTQSCVCLPSGEEIDIASALAPLRFAAVATSKLADGHAVITQIQQAEASGIKLICFDAESNADLDQVVALGLGSGKRVLWAGSAGLAAALARAIAPPVAEKMIQKLPAGKGQILIVVGSDHGASLAQVAELRERTDTLECSLDVFHADDVRKAVGTGRNLLLHLPPCGTDAAKIAAFAQAIPLREFGGIVLTGGDTASTFLRTIGAEVLDVQAEVMPGIPVSIIRGGIADDMCGITKSGAFGPKDAFLRCIEFLARSGNVVEEGARP